MKCWKCFLIDRQRQQQPWVIEILQLGCHGYQLGMQQATNTTSTHPWLGAAVVMAYFNVVPFWFFVLCIFFLFIFSFFFLQLKLIIASIDFCIASRQAEAANNNPKNYCKDMIGNEMAVVIWNKCCNINKSSFVCFIKLQRHSFGEEVDERRWKEMGSEHKKWHQEHLNWQ